MKKLILLSDVLTILKLHVPQNSALFIFDPFERLIIDVDFPLSLVEDNSLKVLVSLADEVICYKGMQLSDFDVVVDFGKSKMPEEFKSKRLNFINNPDNSMRWLYADDNKNATFLSFYNTATLRAKIIARIIKSFFKIGIGSVVRSGSFSVHHQVAVSISRLVAQVPCDGYSIFMGTAGINRTVLLELNTKGQTTHFIKIASSEESIKSIKHENRVLNIIKLKDFKSFTVPKVLSNKHDDVLITQNIQPKNAQRSNQLTPMHYSTLKEIALSTVRFYHLKSTSYWDEMLSNIYRLKKKDKYVEIIDKLTQLKTELEGVTHVYTTLSHADFTPWNIYVKHPKLYVYDWEACDMEAPMLHDLFHFHFQAGVLSERISVQQIKANILAACENKKIQDLIHTYSINIETYFKMYLLKVISQYIGVFQQQKELSKQHQWLLSAYEKALEDTCCPVTETTQREVFVSEFGKELKRTSHAFLKFTEGSLADLQPSSDLDILVLKEDIKSMVNYCNNHLLVKKVKTHQKSFMTIVELYFKDDSFLSIDLLHQFKRRQLQLFDATPLLISAMPNESGVMVPDERFDFEYCFLFYTLNGAAIPKKYKAFYEQKNELQHNRIFNYLNKKYDLKLLNNDELFSYSPYFKLRALSKIKQASFNVKKSQWFNQVSYVLDTLKDILFRQGMIITFSGVDGAGKTTIIEKVKNRLQSKYRKEVVLLRHRPGILPILSAIKHGKKEAEKIASVTLPRKGRNNNVLSSIARFSYYFTDYLIGQVYVYFKYVLRGKIVLYDRYYFDFINDAKRSNIQLNRSFLKVLYRLVFKPKLNFFLYADAATILARKQEMIAPEIDQLTILYKQLFSQMSTQYKSSHYTIIENKELDVTLNTIMKSYAKLA